MVTVKLYVEGAGDGELQRSQCRQAFATFFNNAGIQRRPRVVPCGSRNSAYDAFVKASRTAGEDELPLLLVDAEGPVSKGHSVWQHLKAHDGWDRPEGVAEDQAFLMVQVMETWFLADRVILEKYFGPGFASKWVPGWMHLEDAPKQDVYDALDRATAGCKPKQYCKGKTSFEILSRLDPPGVEAACPHAHKLLERLRRL